MTIWERIGEAISALTSGESLADVFAKLRTPPERSVGFTIAVIALGAKMAKADGQVTRDEVMAFREVFQIPPDDEANAAKADLTEASRLLELSIEQGSGGPLQKKLSRQLDSLAAS